MLFGKKRSRDGGGQESVKTAVARVLASIDTWKDACGMPPDFKYKVDYGLSEATMVVRKFDIVTREQLVALTSSFSAADDYRIGSYSCRAKDGSISIEIVKRSLSDGEPGTAAKRFKTLISAARSSADPAADADAPTILAPSTVLSEDRADFISAVGDVSRAMGSDQWTSHRRPATYDVEFKGFDFRLAAVEASPPGSRVDLERGVLVVSVRRNRPEIVI